MRAIALLIILCFCLVIALSGCGQSAHTAPLVVTDVSYIGGRSNISDKKYLVYVNNKCPGIYTDSLYSVGDTIQ